MNANPAIANSRRAGAAVFNKIVALVRDRTETDYSTAFNRVLADSADLMEGPIDMTNHCAPLLKLFNRAQSATGLSPIDSTILAVDKIRKLTQRYFPDLINAPTALQWTALERTARILDQCGIPQRLFNRTSDPEITSAEWKSTNADAKEVLDWMDEEVVKSKDFGNCEKFKAMLPRTKFWVFSGAINRLMTEGLSRAEAFNKLKDEQPLFWAHSILSFESRDDFPHALP
jgi:hypothetical protein